MKRIKYIIAAFLITALCLSGCAMSDIRDFVTYVDDGTNDSDNKMGSETVVSEPNAVKIDIIESVSYDRYAYQNIDEEVQIVYDQILDCIKKHESAVDVSTTDDAILDEAYRAVFADYGGLFWVSGYVYHKYLLGDKCTRISFEPKYTMSLEERGNYQKQIDAVVADWLSGVSITDSDYEKAKYVFDTIVEKVNYNPVSQENQNIISVFLYEQSVCQGYADAVWYLLDELGIPCTVITGSGNGENHAWNLVYLDKAYYYMDVTWGDTDYGKKANEKTIPRYAYLATTTEKIMQNHKAEVSFELPACVNIYDNYYVKSEKYFDSWRPDDMGRIFHESLQNNGDVGCDIMFSNSELYNQAIQYFITDSQIYNYLSGIKGITYIPDEEARVLTIFIQ